jgi:NAD(P)H-hydrate epimerase
MPILPIKPGIRPQHILGIRVTLIVPIRSNCSGCVRRSGNQIMLNISSVPDVLTREQVRRVDQIAISEFGLCGLVLMENAGRNSAELLRSLGIGGRVVICCGKGNNGGDGYVIARHLENAGVDVRVLLCIDPSSLSGDAATNFHVLQKSQTPLVVPPVDWRVELAAADWIVDALLGTGTQGTLREPYITAVAAINDSGRKVFAVDLPSGLDCDTGQPLGCCVRANHTATFVARKPGFNVPGAEQWTGAVHVVDIGVPRTLFRHLA